MERRFKSLLAGCAGFLATLAVGLPAQAVDGVIEINHAAAVAGGVTSGDTPGYPVTLTAGASYRLTSDLRTSDGNTPIIEGVVPQIFGFNNSNGAIRLDLNGFNVRCFVGGIAPVGASCDGSAIGIDFSAIQGAVIENGTVRGMGSDGILVGDSARIENVVALDNGDGGGGNRAGIRCTGSCEIKDSVASDNDVYGIMTGLNSNIVDTRVIDNGSAGIRLGSYSTVRSSVIYSNDGPGILDSGYALILGNQISQNASFGVDSLNGAKYVVGNNTFVGNNSDGAQFDAFATPLERNNCKSNTLCP